jgi:CheY-like chemotaxis protein
LSLIEGALRRGRVDVKRDYSPDAPDLMADHGQMQQVLLNLFINAQQAMRDGGTLTLTVSAASRADEAGTGSDGVAICVQDTGGGIAPDLLPHVFEPFWTTKGPRGESDQPGTGLGLSVAHAIVTAHGGAIEAESEAGRGTTFTVWLPIAEASREPAPSEVAPVAPPEGPARPLRILVVEDEEPVREAVMGLLAARGHEVVGAAEGAEAIVAFTRDRFDVVIADILMPGTHGTEVLAAVRRSQNPCPVIILTGKGEQDVAGKMALRGAFGTILKPFRAAELLELVAQAAAAGTPPGPD